MPQRSSFRRTWAAVGAVTLGCASVLPLSGIAAADTATPAPAVSVASKKAHVPTGYDISWPNCPKGMGIPSRPTLGNPMPSKKTDFASSGSPTGPASTPTPV